MPLKLDQIDGAFEDAHGLPRPRWDVILGWAEANGVSSAQVVAQWVDVERQWLAKLAAALRGPYRLLESEHFLLLTVARGDAGWMTDFAEAARSQIRELIGVAAPARERGKLVVLVLNGEEVFRRYLAYYVPAGQLGASAGVCVHHGQTHVVLPGLTNYQEVLVHEFVHAHLERLDLPLWVDEGIAQLVSRRLAVRQRMDRGGVVKQTHRGFWKTRGVQPFWSGEGFHRPRSHDAIAMAYELAELVVQEMVAADAPAFGRFLRAAASADAGDAGSRATYGCGVGLWAGMVLGEGDWSPQHGMG